MSIPNVQPDYHAVPRLVADHAVACQAFLDLHHWEISLKMVDRPDNSDEVDAHTERNTRYHRAMMSFRRSITDDDQMREAIFHEHWHLVLGQMALAVERITALLPERLQAHAAELYTDAEEQTVEHLTRAMIARVEAGKKKK